MKKLFLSLALLIVGILIGSQGAFANTYPQCYKGYGVSDPLYNGTNGDKWAVRGWCVDGYGVFTPRTGEPQNSSFPNVQGGMAVPIIIANTPTTGTLDTLIAQQTGSIIVDEGGLNVSNVNTLDTLTGVSGHYTLPPTSTISTTNPVGISFTITSASKTAIFVDTASTADVIQYSPLGVGGTPALGSNIKSPGGAGDSVTLVSPYPGMWLVTNMNGVNKGTTAETLWTGNGTGL